MMKWTKNKSKLTFKTNFFRINVSCKIRYKVARRKIVDNKLNTTHPSENLLLKHYYKK